MTRAADAPVSKRRVAVVGAAGDASVSKRVAVVGAGGGAADASVSERIAVVGASASRRWKIGVPPGSPA